MTGRAAALLTALHEPTLLLSDQTHLELQQVQERFSLDVA
jgi:hypothetical protein